MDYLLHIVVLFAFYGTLAISLDLLVGHAGYLSLCHSALFGIGAYTSAILITDIGLSVPLSLIGAATSGALASVLVSGPSLRLKGDFFLIATLALQMVFYSVINNWIELTRGPLGLSIEKRAALLETSRDGPGAFLGAAGLLLCATFFIARRLGEGPFGRVLHAIRDDEVVAKALGKDTVRFKIQVFGVSATLASTAGGLYSSYQLFIHPAGFTPTESVTLIAMVIIGGAGSKWGPLVGAAVLVLLPESLRFVGLPLPLEANVRQVIYGLALILIVMFRPKGLAAREAVWQRGRLRG